ncbi:DinB family protein [Kribbella orskensis]|uniref:DinB family protein n=1 Tax=Kribbella orskensis TaxID=2512216 RepID=A0ABY2BIF3_9ACTN|nr:MULTISPECIES: DinB family protein [Kribbella]TCN37531.1 DinB family protein [Kribbella sp. VKM Ac-2500]TCO18967.1 DinB family protein [Kribbella orskensis]
MNKRRPPVDGLCDECGFNYDTGDLQGTVTTLVRQSAECSMALTKAAAGPDADVVRIRPEPEVWSAIEYACHVRDVLEVQRFRIAQCLAEDRPVYAPMDRTGRVKQAKYEDQDPMEVAAALMRFAREFGAAARVLTPPQLGKLGLYNYPVRAPRSLGWIIRHTAHEIQHHRQDIINILAELEPPIIPAPKPAQPAEAEAGTADATEALAEPAGTADDSAGLAGASGAADDDLGFVPPGRVSDDAEGLAGRSTGGSSATGI